MTTTDLSALTYQLRTRLLAALDRIRERGFAIVNLCSRADVAARLGRDNDGELLQAVVDECKRQWEEAVRIVELLKTEGGGREMSYKLEAKRLRDIRDDLIAACEAAITFAQAVLSPSGLGADDEHDGYSIIVRLKAAIANARDKKPE